MKKISLLIGGLLLLGTGRSYAQAKPAHAASKGSAAAPRPESLTNKSIIALSGAGLSADLITAKINASSCSFDLSTNGLLALKQAGVADAVMQAMMDRGTGKAAAAKSKPAAPASRVPKLDIANHPYFQPRAGAGWNPLEKATANIKSKLVAMGYGGVKVFFQIPAEQSPTRLASADSAVFLVNTFGTAIPDWVLYKAKPEKGTRAVLGAQAKQMGGTSAGQDNIPFNALSAGNGVFRLVPTAKLLPGEYFFASKPAAGSVSVDAFAFGID